MNYERLCYQTIEDGQENALSEMVWDVFSEFQAPDYSREGINSFREFIKPQRLANEISNNRIKVYCCYDKDDLVGILAVQDITHISLLFVKKSHHRRGIAKELLKRAIKDIKIKNPNVEILTVNSSPYAVEIYRRLGFNPTDNMQEKDGIVFMPMKKYLDNRITTD